MIPWMSHDHCHKGYIAQWLELLPGSRDHGCRVGVKGDHVT